MRKLLSGFAIAAALSTAALAGQKTETVKVSGWHCSGCSAKTETALKEIKGVQSATADKATKTVKVTYDDAQVKRADIDKAITDSGFSVDKG